MGRRISLLTLLLMLVSTPGGGTVADVSCYIVDRDGVEHWVPSWNRLVVREREGERRDGLDPPGMPVGTLDSPGVLSAFVYRGAVIPVEDVSFILPTLGIYVLKDGYQVEARPLFHCGFSKEHRFADLERPRHRSTAGGTDTPTSADRPLLLEAFVEFAATDTVAGYPVAEPRVIPISDARIVVFDPKSVEAAEEIWARRSSALDVESPFSPYGAHTGKRIDLYLAPGNRKAARLEEGAEVEVLEVDGDWARVRLEGWVKTESVKKKR